MVQICSSAFSSTTSSQQTPHSVHGAAAGEQMPPRGGARSWRVGGARLEERWAAAAPATRAGSSNHFVPIRERRAPPGATAATLWHSGRWRIGRRMAGSGSKPGRRCAPCRPTWQRVHVHPRPLVLRLQARHLVRGQHRHLQAGSSPTCPSQSTRGTSSDATSWCFLLR
jgi:hypothetical protein